MASHTRSSRRRLKFAIEFAAIGQQEIEGWLSYFEDMDADVGTKLGRARLHFLVDLTMRGWFLCRLELFRTAWPSRRARVDPSRESGRRRRDTTSPRCATQVSSKEVLDYLGFRDSNVHARGLPVVGRALGRVEDGLRARR